MTAGSRPQSFIEAISKGQELLDAAPQSLDDIASVFRDFGFALTQASSGSLGIACVTKGDHRTIEAEFMAGTPLSIILVVHDIADVPSPIVADLHVDHLGFPVTMAFGRNEIVSNDADELSSALRSLAQSHAFGSAYARYSRMSPPDKSKLV